MISMIFVTHTDFFLWEMISESIYTKFKKYLVRSIQINCFSLLGNVGPTTSTKKINHILLITLSIFLMKQTQ